MPETTNPVDGVRIHYEVDGSGPPLAMLPSVGTSAAVWRAMGYQDAFASSRQVVSIDVRGHGLSDKPTDPAAYSDQRDVEDVVAVLDALGVGRADVWGYSLGARIALILGVRSPHRVRSIIAGGYGPRPAGPTTGVADTETFVNMIQSFYETSGTEFTPALHEAFALNDVRALDAREEAREVLDRDWRGVSWPALIYVGSNDGFFAPASRLAELISGSELMVLEGYDHLEALVPKCQPILFPRVQAFLDSLSA